MSEHAAGPVGKHLPALLEGHEIAEHTVVLDRLGHRAETLQPGLDCRDIPADRQLLDPGQYRLSEPRVRLGGDARRLKRFDRQASNESPGVVVRRGSAQSLGPLSRRAGTRDAAFLALPLRHEADEIDLDTGINAAAYLPRTPR